MIFNDEYFIELISIVKKIQEDILVIKNFQTKIKVDDYLDGQDVMQMLKIAPRTLNHYRQSGTLPFYRIGGKILYKRSEIEKILHDGISIR